MVTRKTLMTIALWAALLLAGRSLQAQPEGRQGSTLTARDRVEIQQLSADYAKTLGTCAADEFAALFAAPDGSFASGPRGLVRGRQRLIDLVRSERQCNAGGERKPRAVPTAAIEPSLNGATGTAPSTLGHYEDVYVRTPQGWKFKSRQVVTAQEAAARLTSKDFDEIRLLAGNASGAFGDVYVKTPEGWRFRSSGVVIDAPNKDKTGKAYLKAGGHYDDVYAKTATGWRFESRTYVSPEQESGKTAPGTQRVE